MCGILVLELRNVVRAIMNPNKCFLIFVVFLHSSLNNLAEGSSKQNIYKKVFFNADHHECVCFEQNHNLVTVPQYLDPQNEEIDRLIIILYRTKNGTIYTYVPNRIKQSVLPDLQYEADDSITNLPNEQLDKLFLNSNKIIKYPLHSAYSQVKQNDSFPTINPVRLDRKPACKIKNKTKDEENVPSACKQNKNIEGFHLKNTTENTKPNLPDNVTQIPYLKEPNIKNDSLVIILPHLTSKINQSKHLDPFDPIDILKHNHTVNQTLPRQKGSFNKWFIDQMKNLELGNSLHQPLNFATLEQLILAALKNRGMLVSPNGILTDKHGDVFNITNLYLRPLLIGESIKYDSVKANPNGSYSLPDVSSYMESVLIAVLDPPKVVAVIPIGKVKVPKTLDFRHVYKSIQVTNHNESNFSVTLLPYNKDLLSYPGVFHEDPKSLEKEHITVIPHLKSIKMLKAPITLEKQRKIEKNRFYMHPALTRIKVNDDGNDNNDFRILGETTVMASDDKKKRKFPYVPKDPRKEPKGVEKKHYKKKNSPSVHIVHTPIDDDDDDNGYHGSETPGETSVTGSGAIRQRISSHVNPIETHIELKGVENKHYTGINPSYIHIAPTPIEVDYDSDDDDDDDYLDFRIIGGAAATGSGIPISNRGRSGKFSF